MARQLAPLLLLLLPHAPLTPVGAGEVELPPGRIAELFDTLGRLGQGSAPPPAPWPAWEDDSESGWGGEATWRQWVELLRAEAHAAEPTPERRVRLALLACAQQRSAEAWAHLLAAGPSPQVSSVLPALLPGVPQALLEESGPLPAGVLLSPGLPPPHDEALASGHVDRLAALVGRSMRATEVRVEGTRFELRVIVEGDGVQVDLVHLEGPAVPVRVLLPLPGGVEFGRVYANWEKIGEGHFPIDLEVVPEPRRQTLWGRFRPRPERWPAPAPDALQGRPDASILVVVPAERLGEARLQRFSEALAELFGRSTRLTTPAEAQRPTLFEPTAIHLGAAPTGTAADTKLLGMLRMIEAHALAGAARR